MGYETNYELRVIPHDYVREVAMDVFVPLLPAMEFESLRIYNGAIKSSGGSRWYEHERDMKELSKKYPELVFQLDGQGHEPEDRWRKYFKSGRMQEARAVLTLAPFDEALLR